MRDGGRAPSSPLPQPSPSQGVWGDVGRTVRELFYLSGQALGRCGAAQIAPSVEGGAGDLQGGTAISAIRADRVRDGHPSLHSPGHLRTRGSATASGRGGDSAGRCWMEGSGASPAVRARCGSPADEGRLAVGHPTHRLPRDPLPPRRS